MDVPKPGAESEPQLLAYTTATATQDPTLLCHLYHSAQQRLILHPLSEARDQPLLLMDASQVTAEPLWELPNILLSQMLINVPYLWEECGWGGGAEHPWVRGWVRGCECSSVISRNLRHFSQFNILDLDGIERATGLT